MAEGKLDGKQLGAYRIVHEIGRGAMATVYRALDTALERVVAIKILHDSFCNDEEFLQRFSREAKISAQLDHPNIVHIYSVGREDGINYFAMQYIDGGSLYEADKPLGDGGKGATSRKRRISRAETTRHYPEDRNRPRGDHQGRQTRLQ